MSHVSKLTFIQLLSWDSKACGRFTAFSRTWVAVFSFGIALRQSQKGVKKDKVSVIQARDR